MLYNTLYITGQHLIENKYLCQWSNQDIYVQINISYQDTLYQMASKTLQYNLRILIPAQK